MLNEFVHTPLAHSVLISLTVVQSEPNAALPEPEPEPEPAASGDGVLLLLQPTDNANAKNKTLPISKSYQRSTRAQNASVTIVLPPRTTRARSTPHPRCSDAESHARVARASAMRASWLCRPSTRTRSRTHNPPHEQRDAVPRPSRESTSAVATSDRASRSDR